MIGKLRRTGTFLQIGHAGSVGTLDRLVAQTGAWTVLPAIDTLAMSPRANRPQIRCESKSHPPTDAVAMQSTPHSPERLKSLTSSSLRLLMFTSMTQ